MDIKNNRLSFRRTPVKISEGLGANTEITSAHLHNAFGINQPHMLNTGYARIFSSTSMYYDKPMIGMTEAKGNIKLLRNKIYRWRLSGDMHQKLRSVRNVVTDPRPGINHSIFEIVLDKPWFKRPDIIQGEDNQYRLRVESDKPVKLGPNAYKYEVQLVTNNPSEFFPTALLEENREFNKVSSAVADESNQDFGGFQFSTVFESEGKLGQFAVKFELTDKAARQAKHCADEGNYGDEIYGNYIQQMRIPFRSMQPDGTMRNWLSFMSMAEAEMHNRIYTDVENALILGRESDHIVSPEGYQITTGSGVREQIEAGNVLTHNGNLTLSQLNDWVTNILKDKKARGKAKIVFQTGIKFAEMFDQMVKEDASSFLTLDTHYIRKGDDTFRHMDYGSYFTSFKGFIVDINIIINPAYDNRWFQPRMHPVYTNYTVDSWRADILDFGSTEAQGASKTDPNISMVAERYCDYSIAYKGKWDPKSGLPITDGGYGLAGGVSGYSLFEEKSAGVMIADVSRCGVIKLALPSVY